MFCSTFSQQFCMIFTLQPICLLPLIGILDILYHFFFHYLVKVLTSFYNILEIIRMLNETRTLHYKPMFSINDAVLSDNHIQFPWGAYLHPMSQSKTLPSPAHLFIFLLHLLFCNPSLITTFLFSISSYFCLNGGITYIIFFSSCCV